MTINKIHLRGGNPASLISSLKYIRKYQGDLKNGGACDSSIKKKPSTSEANYLKLFNRKMEGTRQKNQKNLYAFCSLSFSHADSKKLTDEEALEIAKDFYLNEAFTGSRHFEITIENDKEHKHAHAIIGLTDLKTKKVSNKFIDFKPISNKIESKYNLEKVDRPATPKPSPFSPAPNARKIEERTGQKTIKNDLKECISKAFMSSIDFNEFVENLEAYRVEFIPTTNSGGLSGASFLKDGEMFKGSQLGYPAATIKEKYKSTKGYKQFIDFYDNYKKKNEETIFYCSDKNNKINKAFYLNKNFTEKGNQVFHKNTMKKAYTREDDRIIVHDKNLKTVNQAVKDFISQRPNAIIGTESANEDFKRNIWIVCKQNDFAISDFYKPKKTDYEFAIRNCLNEEQKKKLTNEMNETYKYEEKHGLYLNLK